MKKSQLNFIIDAVLLTLLAAIGGIGFMMKWVLVPGRDRMAVYGSNSDLTLFGLERHDWGEIHLILSFIFLGLLLVHLILHWRFIVCCFRNMTCDWSAGKRKAVSITFLCLILMLLVSPLLLRPLVAKQDSERSHRRFASTDEHLRLAEKSGKAPELSASLAQTANSKEPQSIIAGETPQPRIAERHKHDSDIRGSMTLGEVCNRYRVPSSFVIERLHLPSDTSPNVKLGRLRRQYGFEIDDVRKALSEYPD